MYAQFEEGWGSVCHGYMYILLYVKLILCLVMLQSMDEGQLGSVCHGCMCILYMKLIGYSDVA